MLTFAALTGSAFLTSCALEVQHTTSRRGHDNHHRGHHDHHYWNDAGEAYGEAGNIRSLVVLPIKLPATFTGAASQQELKSWHETWPQRGAALVVTLLVGTPDIHIAASPSQTRPTSGYFLEIEVSEYDLGDVEKANRGSGVDGWSRLNAIGRIFNAQSGKLVVDFAFDEYTVRYDEQTCFDSQMSSIGQNLAEWFRAKQAGKE
jgi:hypothetical protein